MNKTKKKYPLPGEPLYDNQDFMWYFEQRMFDMIRQEVESQFQNMLYKH